MSIDSCILIIDPQKDFISPQGYYAIKHPIQDILETKERINKLIAHVESKILIVHSDYEANQFGDGISMCIPGTTGHQIDLMYNKPLTVFTKNQHDCFKSIEFNTYLKATEIKQLYICGFLAEYCVKETVIAALDKEYSVTLITDCISTGDDVLHRKQSMINEMVSKGAGLTSSIEIRSI